MKLKAKILPNFEVDDPFMIAASHWTGNDAAFRALARFTPSAATLKTTSSIHGGDGSGLLRERDKRSLEDSLGNNFATYTDGPKTQELIDVPTTARNTEEAKKWMPQTKLGLSILSGENYSELAASLPVDKYDYVELNLKYQFRGLSVTQLDDAVKSLYAGLNTFFQAFPDIPKFVKLPREFTTIIAITDLTTVFKIVSNANAGVIVANSKRVTVPPSRTSGKDVRELSDGVVVGEYLFLDTYHSIRALSSQCQDKGFELPIVASGGIMDIGAVLDVLAAGASAVQLCTVLDVRKPAYIEILRQQLSSLLDSSTSLQELVSEIRSDAQKWSDRVVVAKSFRIDTKKALKTALYDGDQALSIVSETLAKECDGVLQPGFPRPPTVAAPDGVRFIYTKGNVASFLMAKRCIEENSFSPIENASATKFFRDLRIADFKWDLGILPESTLNIMQKEDRATLGSRTAVRVAQAAISRPEVVGAKSSGIENIEKVYHFNGLSARHAMSLFLKEHKVRSDDLTGPALVPLLRCWCISDGILAKPPLSRFYGLLCREDVKQEWGQLWSCEEPLWLVASEEFLSTSGGKVLAEHIAWQLVDYRLEMINNPHRWAVKSRSEGLLDHCEELLEGSMI